MDIIAEGQGKGLSGIPLRDHEYEIKLIAKGIHFAGITLALLQSICFNDKYCVSTTSQKESENVSQVSYLAPFPSLGFSTVITIHLSYCLAPVATAGKQQQLLQ